MKLNIYLFQKIVKNFDEMLKPNKKFANGEGYEDITPQVLKTNFEYKIYLEKDKSKPPKWIDFIENYVENSAVSDLKNVVNSMVILLKLSIQGEDRFFSLTNGFGFNAINRDLVEYNFGLITTLNSIGIDKIKSFDSKTFSDKTKQTRTSINQPAPPFDFNVNFESELVRIVSGYCKDENFGKKITGSDNLIITTDVDFPSLSKKCEEIFNSYQKKDYQEEFNFIDNITPIQNQTFINSLEDKLIKDIKNDSESVNIAYPDQIEYERCDYFKTNGIQNLKNEEFPEIDQSTLLKIIENTTIDSKKLKEIKINGYDESNNPNVGSESLFGFLVYETEIEGKKYVLSNKKWFEINIDYLSKLNEDIKIYTTDIKLSLPDWDGEQFSNEIIDPKYKFDESIYNSKVSELENYQLFDQKFFGFKKPYNHNQIEICDLYEKETKSLICVKKLKSSSTLSHLFSQGSVSAKLFAELEDSKEYKKKFVDRVNEKFINELKTVDFDTKKSFTFVYAIGTEKEGDLLDILPIFSKINLFNHIKSITNLGFNVSLKKIRMID